MKVSIMRKVTGCLIIVISIIYVEFAFTQMELPTTTILQNMHKAYSVVTSYQDSGVIEVVADFGKYKQTMTTNFSIWFKQPTSLRVDWSHMINPIGGKKYRSVLWSNGNDTHYFSELSNETEKMKSLMMGIAAATGVSGGAANTIPSMLLPRDYRLTAAFTMLTDLQLIKEIEFEGTQCYVISGKQIGLNYTLWIGKDDYLLRKSEYEVKSYKQMLKDVDAKMVKSKKEDEIAMPDQSMMPDFSSITREIHRNIQINHAIPDSILTFTPPKGGMLVE